MIMFVMITIVATSVHVFSIAYMHEDERFPRFFTYLGLFCFSMLGLVIGGTILQLFVFWELVGLCSYLLIGFWYEKKSASNAAIKAFVVNRVGDFGFLIGFGVLSTTLAMRRCPASGHARRGSGQRRPDPVARGTIFGATALTVMGIGIFCGCVGKRPSSRCTSGCPTRWKARRRSRALVHSATMVAAGVYLVGRFYPIFTPEALLVIAIIGCITLFMAATIAIPPGDIKRVLAYSTVSQLGYMMLALGVGGWMAGLFHLITHAFFKSLLFLCSGSVIHAAHTNEMPQWAACGRRCPGPRDTFLIGVLAIAGAGLTDIWALRVLSARTPSC